MEEEDFDAGQLLPEGRFTLDEIEWFQSFAGKTLDEAYYYLWVREKATPQTPARFLFALELVFEGQSLLISSGEDSEALEVTAPEKLLDFSQKLQAIHGKPVIQRLDASIQPIWRPVMGKALGNILLHPDESGLYYNYAVFFEFEDHGIVLQLAERDGMVVGG